MTIKVGINGYGRIGRTGFRAAVQNFQDIQVVAIGEGGYSNKLLEMVRVIAAPR